MVSTFDILPRAVLDCQAAVECFGADPARILLCLESVTPSLVGQIGPTPWPPVVIPKC